MINSGYFSDELIDKLWNTLFEKQQEISKQLDESEKKYQRQIEINNRLMEESENKFFQRMQERNRLIMVNKDNDEPEDSEDEEDEKSGQRRKKRQNKKETFFDSPIIKAFKEKGWKMHCAVTGENFTPEEKKVILEAGFFLIEKYGNSFLLDIPENFNPREI